MIYQFCIALKLCAAVKCKWTGTEKIIIITCLCFCFFIFFFFFNPRKMGKIIYHIVYLVFFAMLTDAMAGKINCSTRRRNWNQIWKKKWDNQKQGCWEGKIFSRKVGRTPRNVGYDERIWNKAKHSLCGLFYSFLKWNVFESLI